TPGYMDLLPSAHRNIRDASRGTAAGEHGRWIGAGMTQTDHEARRMSVADRLLPVWIGAARVAGLMLGRIVPGIDEILNSLHVTSGVPLPTFIVLLIVMSAGVAEVGHE